MNQLRTLGRAPRLVAAVLAASVTWAVLSGIVTLDAGDHARLVAAVAERQRAAEFAQPGRVTIQPQILAAAPTP
jgi:hypothetical protein